MSRAELSFLARPLLAAIVSLAVSFAALTYLALEGQEVAVLETRRAGDGGVRATRVWVADEDGRTWIEAGNPERDFYADIVRDPRVSLERNGRTVAYVANPSPGPEGHAKIRALLREKYGLADWWVGKLVDTSRSVAVRLDPDAAPGASREPGG